MSMNTIWLIRCDIPSNTHHTENRASIYDFDFTIRIFVVFRFNLYAAFVYVRVNSEYLESIVSSIVK